MKSVKLTGKTFPYRDRLKQLGGLWSAADNCWRFDWVTQKDIDALKMLPGCMVVEDKPEPYTPKRAEPADNPLQSAFDVIDRVLSRDDEARTRSGSTTFYGDDREFYNCFKDKNPTCYMGFSTLGKFVNFVDAIPDRIKSDERRNSGWSTGDKSFYGTSSMEQAIDLARNGWEEGIENASRVAELINVEHALQRRRAYSVAGGNVSVGRLLSGNPAHMVKRPKLPGKKTITLLVQNNAMANITAKSMIARSAICCAIVDLIEKNGFSCELFSITTDYHSMTTPAEHLVVRLKTAGEKLNLPDVAFALGHPSFFRRLGFAAIGQAEELRAQWDGMGSSTEAYNSTHLPEANQYYVPHLKRNARGETIEEMARDLLPIMLPKGLPIQLGYENADIDD